MVFPESAQVEAPAITRYSHQVAHKNASSLNLSYRLVCVSSPVRWVKDSKRDYTPSGTARHPGKRKLDGAYDRLGFLLDGFEKIQQSEDCSELCAGRKWASSGDNFYCRAGRKGIKQQQLLRLASRGRRLVISEGHTVFLSLV